MKILGHKFASRVALIKKTPNRLSLTVSWSPYAISPFIIVV